MENSINVRTIVNDSTFRGRLAISILSIRKLSTVEADNTKLKSALREHGLVACPAYLKYNEKRLSNMPS